MSVAHVFRKCPVCGCGNSDEHLKKGVLSLARCPQCGMIYANPVPAEYATGDYYDRSGADYYVSPAKLEGDYAPVRFQRELRLFRKYCAGGDVLDVGCSSGAFLYHLEREFPGQYRMLGMDVSGPALDYARTRRVPVERAVFPDYDFQQRQYDAVVFWAVLEHLLKPKAYLERAWSILRPNGLCFALVPNLDALAMRILGADYRYVYLQHLNYFSAATLTRLAEPRFQPVGCHYTHFNPVVIWQDWRQQGKDVSNPERAALLKKTTGYKTSPWLIPVRPLYRLAEWALARYGLADNVLLVLRKCEAPAKPEAS